MPRLSRFITRTILGEQHRLAPDAGEELSAGCRRGRGNEEEKEDFSFTSRLDLNLRNKLAHLCTVLKQVQSGKYISNTGRKTSIGPTV
jgi:hypothetical protein